MCMHLLFFFFQAEDGIRDLTVTGFQTCALPISAVLLESSTQELARQHAYLDALIASTPVAIAVLDNQRSVRSVNPAFETLFGYSAAEVEIGRASCRERV